MIGRVPDRSRQVARIVTLSPHGEFCRWRASLPLAETVAETHGEAGLEVFHLFLSAFGFFFSRLLLNYPFAISSSILHAKPAR